MQPEPRAVELQPYLQAGAASGAAGLAVFLVSHHIWIVPIWFILPVGLPLALAAGACVGWACAELQPRLPGRPWTAGALLVLVAVVLSPALVLAELRAPMFDLGAPGGAQLLMSPGRAVVVFVLELLLTAGIVGAVLGWLIGRRRSAIIATSAAAVAFALGPGHNIPFGGGTDAVPKEIALMVGVAAVSAVALVEVHARLAKRSAAIVVAAPDATAAPSTGSQT
jgi:hypothetical protein